MEKNITEMVLERIQFTPTGNILQQTHNTTAEAKTWINSLQQIYELSDSAVRVNLLEFSGETLRGLIKTSKPEVADLVISYAMDDALGELYRQIKSDYAYRFMNTTVVSGDRELNVKKPIIRALPISALQKFVNMYHGTETYLDDITAELTPAVKLMFMCDQYSKSYSIGGISGNSGKSMKRSECSNLYSEIMAKEFGDDFNISSEHPNELLYGLVQAIIGEHPYAYSGYIDDYSQFMQITQTIIDTGSFGTITEMKNLPDIPVYTSLYHKNETVCKHIIFVDSDTIKGIITDPQFTDQYQRRAAISEISLMVANSIEFKF